MRLLSGNKKPRGDLALAGVGLALAIADEIGQAITGRSFMKEAMGAILDPLMKAIIQPLMQFFTNLFSKILEGLGMEKGLADTIAQIMGAIQAAVLMIAAVMVAGSLVKSVAQKIGSTIIVKTSMAFAKKCSKTWVKSGGNAREETRTQYGNQLREKSRQ